MFVKVTREDDKIYVSAPYNPTLIERAHAIGGRLERARKAWVYPQEREAEVKALYIDIYGEYDAYIERTTIQIPLKKMEEFEGQPLSLISVFENCLWLCGRLILRRPMVDTAVMLEKGIEVVSGGFPPSGGTLEYPELAPLPTTIIEIPNVPLEKALALGNLIEITARAADKASLLAEKAKLLERLAQIEIQLQQFS